MNAAAAKAKTLRTRINALSLDLAHCTTAAETRCVKQAIRAAEFELTVSQ